VIEQALEIVHKTGEELHRPELLRLRAVYSLAQGDDGAEAAADLAEAIRVASEQGARVARLRAALELARLPDDARPADWRSLLEEARRGISSPMTTAETADADHLLTV
jgi:hypothetical protein